MNTSGLRGLRELFSGTLKHQAFVYYKPQVSPKASAGARTVTSEARQWEGVTQSPVRIDEVTLVMSDGELFF